MFFILYNPPLTLIKYNFRLMHRGPLWNCHFSLRSTCINSFIHIWLGRSSFIFSFILKTHPSHCLPLFSLFSLFLPHCTLSSGLSEVTWLWRLLTRSRPLTAPAQHFHHQSQTVKQPDYYHMFPLRSLFHTHIYTHTVLLASIPHHH